MSGIITIIREILSCIPTSDLLPMRMVVTIDDDDDDDDDDDGKTNAVKWLLQ